MLKVQVTVRKTKNNKAKGKVNLTIIDSKAKPIIGQTKANGKYDLRPIIELTKTTKSNKDDITFKNNKEEVKQTKMK